MIGTDKELSSLEHTINIHTQLNTEENIEISHLSPINYLIRMDGTLLKQKTCHKICKSSDEVTLEKNLNLMKPKNTNSKSGMWKRMKRAK